MEEGVHIMANLWNNWSFKLTWPNLDNNQDIYTAAAARKWFHPLLHTFRTSLKLKKYQHAAPNASPNYTQRVPHRDNDIQLIEWEAQMSWKREEYFACEQHAAYYQADVIHALVRGCTGQNRGQANILSYDSFVTKSTKEENRVANFLPPKMT